MFLNLKFSPRRLPRRSAYICPAALNSCSQATLDDDAMLSRLIGLSRGGRSVAQLTRLSADTLAAPEAKRKKGRSGGCDIPRPARIITTTIQPLNSRSFHKQVGPTGGS